MISSKTKGNVAMGVSKFFSGLNQNALRFLLPTWMNAISGVMMRLGFGAIAFWIIGFFLRKKAVPITWRKRLLLLGIGMVLMFGYMITLLLGLTYTTPVSSSIFICMQPVWVFILCMIFFKEKATWSKSFGIILGFAGALICILSQKKSEVATDPMVGNLYSLASSVLYSMYLVACAKFLKGIDNITVSKWTFTGGAISTAIAVAFVGFDAPVLHQHIFSAPMLSLLYVLIFPSCISYWLLDVGLKNLKPTVVALYGYLILIVSTITSYILKQDRFDWVQIIAMVMIVASVYFVEIVESKKADGQNPAKSN